MKFVIRQGSDSGKGAYLYSDPQGWPKRRLPRDVRWCTSSVVAHDLSNWTVKHRDDLAEKLGGRVVRVLSPADVKQKAEAKGRAKALEEVQRLIVAVPTAQGARLRRAVAQMLCPCQGPLDDPGPDHVEACPWKDPNYDDGGF